MKVLESKVRRAEIKIATSIVKHNIPIAFIDHLSPLMKDIFPDSEIARNYMSARTKTSCIINGALAPYYKDYLVENMKKKTFTISIDGSNDTGLEKMNPMTVKIFDGDTVKHQFLDMCTTKGTSAGKAETIFTKMDGVFNILDIPWSNCVAVSVDNASVNLGIRNSIKSRVTQKNSAVYFLGCPCHILHNTASKAADAFAEVVGFDIEDICVDIGYWFDKSTNRKGGLEEFCTFCDTEYREVVMHCSTRWLSLQKAVDRNLQLYESLKSYFLSNNDSSARYKRLLAAFNDPMTEVYMLFIQSVIHVFTRFNLLLQRQDPSVHILYQQMYRFLKNLMGKFIKPILLTCKFEELPKIDYLDCKNQLDDKQISIGLTTKSKLNSMLQSADISPYQEKKFYRGVRVFYEKAINYALDHLPLDDIVIQYSQFIDVQRRLEADINQVMYFCERFEHLIGIKSPHDQECLNEEFVDYQTISDSEIPSFVWKEAALRENNIDYYRPDVLWAFLLNMKCSLSGQLRFKRLGIVATLVATLPHSNADEERVFSFIRQNKTDFRDSLQLEQTLSSLLTIKMAVPEPCNKFEPPQKVLDDSKSATSKYNKEHCNNN